MFRPALLQSKAGAASAWLAWLPRRGACICALGEEEMSLTGKVEAKFIHFSFRMLERKRNT